MNHLLLKCDALPGVPRVLAFRGEEELGRCFEYEICCTLDDTEWEADPMRVLGEPASLTLGEYATQISGRVAELEMLEDAPLPTFRLKLVPALWFLRLSAHSRVFVDESVPAIIEKVLEQAGLASGAREFRLTRDYPRREHVCQYHESDLDFIQRWMEREGLYYFFDHGAPESPLVICDAMSHHGPIRTDAVPYHPVPSVDESWTENFARFHSAWRTLPNEVAEADYNYLAPARRIHAAKAVAPELAAVVREWAENVADDGEAGRLAELRREQELCHRKRHMAKGLVYEVHSGFTFTLDRHPEDDMNREYLAVRVVLRGQRSEQDDRVVSFFGPEDAAELGRKVFQTEVEAIDSDVQFRSPRRSPWPRAAGLELAIVDGPADDDYAQLDDHGRYLVKLMMDENPSQDGRASTRVRMVQPHGGEPEGWHLPLRKGTEVLVAFVGGDPDRPVIVGAVPNVHTPSPVTRTNGTQNVLQTGGWNRVELEDADGKQYIDISTPPQTTYLHLGAHAGLGDHNIAMSTRGDGLIQTGGNRDITINGDQNEDVQGSLTESYHANQTTHVAAAFQETIDTGATQTLHAGSTQTITGGLTQTISGSEQRSVSGGTTETINGSRTQTIHGSSNESISATQTQTIGGGATITSTGTYTVKADGGITIQTSGVMNMMSNTWLMNAAGGQMNVDDHFLSIASENCKFFALQFQPNFINLMVSAVNVTAVGARYDRVTTKVEVSAVAIANSGTKITKGNLFKVVQALSIKTGPLMFL